MRVAKPFQLDSEDKRPCEFFSSANVLKRTFKFTVASLLFDGGIACLRQGLDNRCDILGNCRGNTPLDHRDFHGIVHDQARHHRIGENPKYLPPR